MKKSDNDLLQAMGNDDHEAFKVLFLRYYSKIKLFLTGFLKDENEAEDLTQDLFIKLWLNRNVLVQVNNLNAYLFRVAKNMVLNHLEQNRTKESYIAKSFSQPPLYEDIIEDNIYAEELSHLIWHIIENMPRKRRQIFKMSRNEGLSNDEIANLLNLSKRTVENQITNALSEIKKIIYSSYNLLF